MAAPRMTNRSQKLPVPLVVHLKGLFMCLDRKRERKRKGIIVSGCIYVAVSFANAVHTTLSDLLSSIAFTLTALDLVVL